MDRIYVAEIERGKNSPNWAQFYVAVTDMNGKGPDHGGITKTALISSHHDKVTVRMMITTDMPDRSDVTVEEVTAKTLKGEHRMYTDLVESYFLPHKHYPNIE